MSFVNVGWSSNLCEIYLLVGKYPMKPLHTITLLPPCLSQRASPRLMHFRRPSIYITRTNLWTFFVLPTLHSVSVILLSRYMKREKECWRGLCSWLKSSSPSAKCHPDYHRTKWCLSNTRYLRNTTALKTPSEQVGHVFPPLDFSKSTVKIRKFYNQNLVLVSRLVNWGNDLAWPTKILFPQQNNFVVICATK